MKKQPDPVVFNEDSLRELRALYDVAVRDGKDLFTYRGREYSTRYAYYLMQFLRGQFSNGQK